MISWLASYPKSGNTWLRLFLASYDAGGPVNINNLPQAFDISDNREDLYFRLPLPVDKLQAGDTLYLRGAVLLSIMAGSRKPCLVKTHNARVTVADVMLIPQVYTGPSVYIVRDPRDVAISFAHWAANGDIDAAIEMMDCDQSRTHNRGQSNIFHFLGRWSDHVRSWQRDDVLTIRYEDIGPEVFERVLVHLGIEVDAERVERAAKEVTFDRLKGKEASAGFLEKGSMPGQFFRVGKAGQWRDVLTSQQVDAIEKAHGPVMAEFSYA